MSSKVSEVKPEANKEELEVALSGGALHANRVFLTIMPDGLRIAFAERSAKDLPIFFRTAVTLSFQDGATLDNLIQEALRRREAALEGHLPAPKAAKEH